MLADSLTELFAARALAYETARGIDRGGDVKVAHAQCSMAKLYCSEMAGRVADRAVQVFGGRGYMRENVAERFYRELRVERIWEGTSEVQRAIIAGQMVKRGPGVAGLIARRSAGQVGLDGGDQARILGRDLRPEPGQEVPSGPTRNFSKFHWMSPASPLPSGAGSAPHRWGAGRARSLRSSRTSGR